jgi:hypothetical protein
MNTLTTAPFSYAKDATIGIGVRARNAIGYGHITYIEGAAARTSPEAPISIPVRGPLTNGCQIELILLFDETRNGGSAVTELDLWWNQGQSTNTWQSISQLTVDESSNNPIHGSVFEYNSYHYAITHVIRVQDGSS